MYTHNLKCIVRIAILYTILVQLSTNTIHDNICTQRILHRRNKWLNVVVKTVGRDLITETERRLGSF